jgi:plastocyanin
MKRPMLSRRCCFAFAAVLALAMSAVSAHAETIRIVMDKLVYSPVEAKAAVGDTIEWVNNDILAHTATARNGDWDVAIAAKKTVSLVLKKAGIIDYYCRYHPNMKGRIVVAPK